MKKGLAKFLISILIVFSLVAVIDYATGCFFNYMTSQISNQGDTGKTYYSLNDVSTPIIVVGSSRAAHHYVSNIIEDSLGLTTYNVGRDGCFFSYNCCVINSILDRYKPEMIIWENGIDYLFEEGSDPLESLYPYYNINQWVNKTIREESKWTEQIRLSSSLYQYNSSIHKILMRYVTRTSFIDRTQQGYAPLTPKKLTKSLELTVDERNTSSISEIKKERFEQILKRAQVLGVKLVVVDSPIYAIKDNISNESLQVMKEICNKYGAKYIDNTQIEYFHQHPELFNDKTHLNDDGAIIYTNMFLKEIHNF